MRAQGDSLPAEETSPGTRKNPSRRRFKRIIILSLTAFLLTLIGAATYSVLKYYHVYTLLTSSTGKTLPPVSTSQNIPQPTALPNDLAGIDHFNLLLLGSDNDAKFGNGAVLTQTDIVVRIDVAHHHITMVSIPRDMWITSDEGQCCFKLDEISGAETDNAQTPLDEKLHGFAHTAATIEADFHIPIDAYAWVGLDGFVKVINTLGGVDVDVLHPVVDDAYPNDVSNPDNPYSYTRLYIPAGPQHLDGEEALDYVRSRHSDLQGDFGRSARQQSVLIALKKKLDSSSILDNLDAIASDLQGSILTSLNIGQAISLAQWAKGLQSTDITQVVLSAPSYGYLDTVDGKSVVQPIWPAINQTISQIFS